MSIENNLKKKQNFVINQTNQGVDLVKSTKQLSLINGILVTLGIINFLILTYLYSQTDIIYCATGWFSIPEKIHWYYIFLILIVVRMVIVFTTGYFAEYIKNFSLWTEKQKKNALRALAVINFLTIPINLPLIGSFYAYIQGREILSNNWFLGMFRRILNENERVKLYQETVQNFLEKIEDSKEIKDQLKSWAVENKKSILEKYDDGSASASQYVSEKLKIQLEEIKKQNFSIQIEDFIDKKPNDSQGWLPWVYEQTTQGLNYFNPWVTDGKTCIAAWGLLLGTGFMILLISKWQAGTWDQQLYGLKKSTQINSECIKKQAELTNQNFIDVTKILKAQDLSIKRNKMDTDAITTLLYKDVIAEKTLVKRLSDRADINQQIQSIFHDELLKTQKTVQFLSKMPLTPEKKEIMLKNLSTYENSPATMTIFQEMFKDFIKNF